MQAYVLKLYHLFKYLGYSDYELINLIENANENRYSDAYKVYQKLDEFKLVKFKQLVPGPIAYTYCHNKDCAIKRFKEDLLPICPLGISDSVDSKLLSSMIDTNTKIAEPGILRQIED